MDNYKINDTVILKKKHPCLTKSNQFIILGFDGEVRLKCKGCNGIVLLKKASFYDSVKGKINESN